ncbi:MAG TPA: Ig-like domain-containing protein, partial [Polyangiaceae bacterium]|nr:Ig-like domain-containing protein [Polyangiaceae bacterium]
MTPANGDDNVSVHTPIQVAFSDVVQLGDNPLTLVGPGSAAIAAKVTLSSDQKTITIAPGAALVAPTKLSVTWEVIKDAGGVDAKIADPWSWTVPLWLRVGGTIDADVDPSGGTIGGPFLVAGPGDRVTVASNTSGIEIQTVANYSDKWTKLDGVLNGAGGKEASVTVDKNGAVALSFVDTQSNVRAQGWLSGAGW